MVWRCTWCEQPMKAMADFTDVRGKPTVVYQCENEDCRGYADVEVVNPANLEILNVEKEPSKDGE